MRVVGTFHPSSSVLCSLKCCLTPDTTLEYLVIARTDRLDVFSLQPHGSTLECTTDMWGRVVGLHAVPAQEAGRSHVVVMIDHPDPKLVLMSYSTENGSATLKPKSHLSLFDRAARQAEFVTDFRVDPTGKLVVASCYAGRLKVILIKEGELEKASDISLPELNLLAFAFLHTQEERSYSLALLHLNHRRQIQLLCRDLTWTDDDFELSPAHSNLLITTVLSERNFPSLEPPPLLVPIPAHSVGSEEDEGNEDSPAHRGGVLVLGGKKIIFYEHVTKDQQDKRKGKQRRLSKRLESEQQSEVVKGREKEKERESRKIKPRASVQWPWAAITAWCKVDEGCRRVLLGDAYGRLVMLTFDNSKMCLILIPLGETSPATCMSYLSSQALFLGSHLGDSQILRVSPVPTANIDVDTLPIPNDISPVPPSSLISSDNGKGKAADMDDGPGREGRIVKTKGTYLETVRSYDNIAPIMDAVLSDIDESGQPQVITCSGARNTGSLRVIRTEADFQKQGTLEGLSGITNIWPVKPTSGTVTHSHLVVSTLRETLVFSFADKETISHQEPSAAGFATNVPTFALGNIPRRQAVSTAGRTTSSYVDSPLVVQITLQGVQLVEYDQALHVFSRAGERWYPKELGGDYAGREVVAAAMSPSQFVVGLSGGRLALLNLGQNDTLQLLKVRDFPDEICAISCEPFDPTKQYATTIAVSFWGSNKVVVLALDSPQPLNTICEATLSALPCSILLHNLGSGTRPKDADFQPHLIVGLADGAVVTYMLGDGTLQDRKQSALGNAPVSLSLSTTNGQTVVFASATRTNVLYWDRQRVRSSPFSIKDMIRSRTLNTDGFPSCLAIATSSALFIGNVRGLDKMQIRTIPLGLDNPRRIAFHTRQGVFGVACTRISPARIGDYEEVQGSFKLLDVHSGQQLHSFACNPDEEPSALMAVPTEGSGSSPAFCLGTVVIRPEEREPSRGRIILLSVTTEDPHSVGRSLRVLVSEDVKGCVYAFARLSDNVIAAAVNTSVVLFRSREVNGSSPLALEKVTEWNHNYFLTSLVWDGEHLLVGDAISSVSVLKWTEETERLESIARDFGPLWPISLEGTGNGIIGANSDYNIFSFSLQRGAQRASLEKDGVYYIDDSVTKFVRGALSSAEVAQDQAVKASHVFFTSSGRIGTIMEINDDMALHMTALQRNMAKTITGPGEVNHTIRRAPASQRGHTDAEASYGFLDGDFLETFLSHPQAEQFLESDIEAERITLPSAIIKDVLTQMQGLH